MAEHMKLSDMPQFCEEVKTWLKARYGEEKGIKLWEATGQQYNRYLEELPDYGGKKSSHALAIYGSTRVADNGDWLSGRKNLPEILLGYHQHCGSYYKHSHCNLYWNQMLRERLDGRTRILLRKTQGDFMVQSFKAE